MTTIDELRPSTIDGIKRLADRLQTRSEIRRSDALDAAARRGGFQNYAHARRAIEQQDARELSAAEHSRRIDREHQEYRDQTSQEWSETIDAVAGASLPASRVWTDLYEIIDALEPFMGTGRNHGYFPTGGGHDFSTVRPSSEADCIELAVGELAYIMRPRRLRLERIPPRLSESFLFLELRDLPRVYPLDEDEEEDGNDPALSRWQRRRRESEELVDLGGGDYVEREVWDRGYLDYDDEPLSARARLVQRLLRGNVMIVCKASIWNRIPQTYNGMHDQMGPDRVRREIERGLERRQAQSDRSDGIKGQS